MLVASTQTAIGSVVLFASVVIAAAYAFINIRNSRAEVGSEIELAANRRPYLSDEELEGTKLTRTLTMGMLGLLVVAVTLPLYWLAEPGRQDGAVADIKHKFVNRGAALFATSAEGGYDCAFCHGGMQAEGGAADYTVTDAEGGFVKQVSWQAPALNTVLLRYDREELRYILNYGRPFSPMPAWGLIGGGPLNDQQIQNLIDYMWSIQITPEESQAQVTAKLAAMREERVDPDDPNSPLKYPEWISDGELLFNLGETDGFAGGAYSCARCHTAGWSSGEHTVDGSGALGPSLRDGASRSRFPGSVLGPEQQIDFVCTGSEEGAQYGANGQGTGRMPGFCQTPDIKASNRFFEVAVEEREPSDPHTEGGMLTRDQVAAIVEYERGL